MAGNFFDFTNLFSSNYIPYISESMTSINITGTSHDGLLDTERFVKFIVLQRKNGFRQFTMNIAPIEPIHPVLAELYDDLLQRRFSGVNPVSIGNYLTLIVTSLIMELPNRDLYLSEFIPFPPLFLSEMDYDLEDPYSISYTHVVKYRRISATFQIAEEYWDPVLYTNVLDGSHPPLFETTQYKRMELCQ